MNASRWRPTASAMTTATIAVVGAIHVASAIVLVPSTRAAYGARPRPVIHPAHEPVSDPSRSPSSHGGPMCGTGGPSYVPAVSNEPAIRVDGLRMRYGNAEAVKGIDLEVARGEIFCFLGPNG